MNIAIIGHGKMGKEIEKIALARGITIKSIIDPVEKTANYKEITEQSLKDVDVCIDFTRPEVAIENIKKIAKLGKNLVVGTTGWYDRLPEVKETVKKSKIGFIYASNFSIGVNMFFRITENAAKLINSVQEYDVKVHEIHHTQKLDAPSGTAKSIANILIKNIDRKTEMVTDAKKLKSNKELLVTSERTGIVPGTHMIKMESEADIIELKHEAKSRKGFALGAVMAAEWLKGKKGFFEINDMMDQIIGGK